MSEHECKCTHNDHGHFLIWMCILGLCFNASIFDCSGDHRRTQDRLNQLDSEVQQLKIHGR